MGEGGDGGGGMKDGGRLGDSVRALKRGAKLREKAVGLYWGRVVSRWVSWKTKKRNEGNVGTLVPDKREG